MLCLLGVLLSCGALCLTSPVPPTAGTDCAISYLIQETLSDVEMLESKDHSRIMTPDILKAEGNTTTYLEGFIEVLKSSGESKEGQIAQKLQKIQDARKSCLGWTEEDWKPEEDENFFSNLDNLLRFLNHNAPWEDMV